jgi:hypothetical protein
MGLDAHAPGPVRDHGQSAVSLFMVASDPGSALSQHETPACMWSSAHTLRLGQLGLRKPIMTAINSLTQGTARKCPFLQSTAAVLTQVYLNWQPGCLHWPIHAETAVGQR